MPASFPMATVVRRRPNARMTGWSVCHASDLSQSWKSEAIASLSARREGIADPVPAGQGLPRNFPEGCPEAAAPKGGHPVGPR